MPRDEDEDDRPRRRRRADDEDEDDRPRRRRRDEEEDEDRPRRRRRDDDEDEEEDRPRRRRRYEDEDDEDDYVPRRGRRLSRETLRGIAGNHKVLMVCIVVYLGLIAAQFALPERDRWYLIFPVVPVLLTAGVFVYLLAAKVLNAGVGIVLAILTLIPIIGLIVLAIMSAKAVSVLKESGVPVGFFGASSSDI